MRFLHASASRPGLFQAIKHVFSLGHRQEFGFVLGDVIPSDFVKRLSSKAPLRSTLSSFTPRAVHANKFMNGLAGVVMALDDPEKLMVLMQTLGFGPLHLDVTVPRAVIFRNAIMDLFCFAAELAERFPSEAARFVASPHTLTSFPVPLSDRVSRGESREGCPWRPSKT